MKTAGVFITRKCNLRCPYCNVPKSNMKELSFEEWKKALDILQKRGIEKIHFLGGEVSLYEKFYEIVEYALSLNMESSFTTNGVVSKNLVERIIKSFGKKVGIGLSIDDLEIENSISPAKAKCGLKLIEYLQNENLLKDANIIIYTVLCKKNVKKIKENVKYFSSLGIYTYILPFHWDKEERYIHRKSSYENAFVTSNDIQLFKETVDEIKELKNQGYLVNNSITYLDFAKEHIKTLDGRCSFLSEIRVNCDGKLMCCCDKNGKVYDEFCIFDLDDDEKFSKFLQCQREDASSCPGCLWPSVYESEIREKNV